MGIKSKKKNEKKDIILKDIFIIKQQLQKKLGNNSLLNEILPHIQYDESKSITTTINERECRINIRSKKFDYSFQMIMNDESIFIFTSEFESRRQQYKKIEFKDSLISVTEKNIEKIFTIDGDIESFKKSLSVKLYEDNKIKYLYDFDSRLSMSLHDDENYTKFIETFINDKDEAVTVINVINQEDNFNNNNIVYKKTDSFVYPSFYNDKVDNNLVKTVFYEISEKEYNDFLAKEKENQKNNSITKNKKV